MAFCDGSIATFLPLLLLFCFLSTTSFSDAIPSTLDGPFTPVTITLDTSLRGKAVDLPDTDPRVQRYVTGFEPEQISLALSSNYDSVWVSWITGEFQIGTNVKPLDPTSIDSIVQFGTSSGSLTHTVKGSSLVYNQLYPFEGLLNYTSGIIHHVRITGLNPSTVYYYRCGDPSHGMSKIHSFKTMPVSSPTSYPSRIAIVGDTGLTYNTTATISHLVQNNPDLVLLVGDVSYANLYLTNGTSSDCYSCNFSNTPIHETYQPRWDYWGRFMENLTSRVPLMVVEGNHELELQAGNKTFEAYSSRFAFPYVESGSTSKFYYSFNAGGIHFVMLGAYIDFARSGAQYEWLKRDLAKFNRSVTPWLVVTWHPPWYSTYTAHYKEAECMKVHAYERSNRVYNYQLDPCGPVHIVIGDGGNREKMAIEHTDEPGKCPDPLSTPDAAMGGQFCPSNSTATGAFCWDQQPPYSALRESSFGHGILEMKNATWALWTWHRNQDTNSQVGDQIYIVRQPDLCPPHNVTT
ncbi:unnamed protein product [Eruca vesicaria subsp. sativa]|uniref:Purple acid phosphatase n=1 Tax=Eruca vesicaria subsp. sativa TaxID=29727 RepID=A0ABC8KD44_ERUVS|nr:unnamed protein product [Eruca vesicaria subsp. sativa]